MRIPPDLRAFYRLAIPIIMQMLFLSARNIADILMTASLGTVAVASIGLASKAILVGMVALGGLASGCSVMGAQHWGARNLTQLRLSLWLGLFSSALLVLLPVLLLFCGMPERLMSLASDDPRVVGHAASYLNVFGPAFFFLTLNTLLGMGLRVSGQAGAASRLSLLGVLLNIILAYGLVFGRLGLPALGMQGAAWATLLSAALETAALLGYHLRYAAALLPRLSDLQSLSLPVWRSYASVALPATLNGLLWALGIFIYNLIYGRMGTDMLAVMASLTPLESVSAAVEQGLASATAILLGHTLGRREFAQARADGIRYLKFSTLTSFGLGLLLWAAMPLFLRGFPLEAAHADTAAWVYQIMILTFWVKTVNAVGISGVLRSGGDVHAGLRIDVVGQWGVGIPIALLGAFVFKLSLPWVFALVMLEDVCKLFLTTARIKRYLWLRSLSSPTG